MKKEFLQLDECFFKGYVIKFFEWFPNCKEEKLNFFIPTWVTLQSVPPELMHLKIIKRIGSSIGKLIGIDASCEFCNSVRLLIKCRVNSFAFDPIKIITNTVVYNIKCLRNEAEIFEIFRLDVESLNEFKKIELTFFVEDALPSIKTND